MQDKEFLYVRPVSLTVEHRLPQGSSLLTFYGPAYIQNSRYKNCVAQLKFVPRSEEQDAMLPRNAIGWGSIPAQPDGTFNLTIVYEPEHEARVLGLRNLALAKDTTVQLFVEAIVDREVAVLSCEVSEDYSLPSEYRAERGF